MGFLRFSLFIALFSFSVSSLARGFYSGAQSLSFADAGRAGIGSGEAPLLNPSLLGFNRSEVFSTYADGSPSDHSHTTNFGFTLVEASPQNFSPGALSYRHLRRFGDGLSAPANGRLWHGALGKLISPRVAIGISAYHLSYSSAGVDIPDQWNGSFGLTYLANPNLGLAYVLDSPLEVSSEVPVPLREERTHSLALFYKIVENSRLRMDLSKKDKQNPSDRLDFSFGYEIKASEFFVLRLGHKWEGSSGVNRAGAGFGFAGPRLRLDYGLQQNLKNSETMHGVDLRISF